MVFSFRKKIIMSVFASYAKTQAKIHPLTYLFWECTLRCNLNCIHCGSDCKKTSSVPDMPLEHFLNVLEEIKKTHDPGKIMIVLTGGEPLMRPDLEECGKQITKQGFPWGCVTNGMLLDKDKFNRLRKAGLRSMTLSLDGLEDNHKWMRGNSESYQNAIRTLDIISSDKDLVYDVVTCVNQRNIGELNEIRNLLIKKGVKAWRLFTVSPIGRAKTNDDLKLDSENIKKLFEFIKLNRQDSSIKISMSCEAYAGNYETEIRDGIFFCRAGVNIASVLIDGSVSACPNNSKSFIQGNIYNERFTEIWNARFENMRDRRWMKTGICKSCGHFKYCNGGAMHLRENEKSDISYCLWYEMTKRRMK